MKLIFISDTHTRHNEIKIPDGDILIHCGDVSSRGIEREIVEFLDWFGALPHQHKIMIPGNHDFLFEIDPQTTQDIVSKRDIHLLNDSLVEIEGMKFWGSPVTPWFHNWAFNRYRGSDIQSHWNKIPEDIDVLITHGPPAYIDNGLSLVAAGEDVGCLDLYNTIKKRVKPKVHAFGHIHEGYGTYDDGETIFINCSILNRRYVPTNKPIELNYSGGKFSLH
jgi:Icc-related predicted phosphoesterase